MLNTKFSFSKASIIRLCLLDFCWLVLSEPWNWILTRFPTKLKVWSEPHLWSFLDHLHLLIQHLLHHHLLVHQVLDENCLGLEIKSLWKKQQRGREKKHLLYCRSYLIMIYISSSWLIMTLHCRSKLNMI